MNRIVNAITPLGDALKFKSLQGDEGLSCLSEWTVRFVSEHAKLDLQSMLGQSVTFEIETGASHRFLNGIVTGFELLHRETRTPRYYIYQATVRSWLWYATQNSDNRIFQNETAVDIISKVLGKYDFAVEIRLMNRYRKWGYCVQFQETDFSFVSRLMEHEGIYYWFRHEASRHVLVLTDEAQSHDPLPVLPVIPFYPDDRPSVAMQACIADWQVSGELTPTGYATMDYDFQKPLADMSAKRRTSPRATQGLDLEMYEPMGGYVDSSDSEHYVKVHLQSLQCLQEQAVARSNVRTMAPGYTFTLKNYPHQAENRAYLVVHTEYDIQNPAYASHDQPDDQARYVVTSRHIPANVQYRAARSTPIPKMSGPQTATVVGPQGEEIWTDKYGRIKVQFHWDREGAMDENSSCWIRVSNPWAGGGFGGVQIPRVREEVVVDFINGNIDRPIAVGRVYNASNMPPVNLPDDATQSGFLTRSKNGTPANANKLMFEDRQGSELLAMVAEKDMDTHVKNNQTHDVAGNVVSAIAGLRSHTAHSTSDITMAAGAVKNYQADHNRTVQGSLDEQIGANLQQSFNDGVDETITGALTSTIGGQASHTLQGLHITTTTHDEETVNGTVSETVGTGETSNIKSGSQLQAGDITMASPTIYSESTQEEIDIKAGASLDISSAGPGIVQTPGKIIKESPVNVETALMLDNNTVTRKKSYTLDLSVDGIKDVMVEGHNHNQNIADIKLYGMGDSMQAANIGLYGANIQLGGQDQKMGLLNVNITGIELDKGFKIKRPGGGGGVGTKGKGKDGSGGDGGKGGKGDKDGNGNRGDADKPHADCKDCMGRSGFSIGFDVGDERIAQSDFSLSGAFPISWDRVYRSNFSANDEDGPLGPRWITPFTLFIQESAQGLAYYSIVGRTIETSPLALGEERYDRSEEINWRRLDEQTLVISQKHERFETFRKIGATYRLVSIADRVGNKIDIDYQEQGLLRSIQNDVWVVRFEHDEQRRIRRIMTDVTHDGNTVQRQLAGYQYDEAGDLVRAADEYLSERLYAYNHHLITRYSDRTGRGINLEWKGTESNARCFREYADDGSHEIVLSWDRENRLTHVTNALGQTTTYRFDQYNYISHIYFPDGTIEERKRDDYHNIIAIVNPDGTIDRFEYDARDNLVRHIRRDNTQVSWIYNQDEQLVQVTDAMGAIWRRQYNDRQQMIRQTDPLGRVTEFTYNLAGSATAIKDAKGGVKRVVYNNANKILQYADCSNNTTTWEYDHLDRVVGLIDAEGKRTAYDYDNKGHLSRVIEPDGELRLLSYDAEGRLLSAKDALGQETLFSYDAAGRLARRISPISTSIDYRYDRTGKLTQLINENNEHYSFTYDPFGRLLEESGFDKKITKFTYTKNTGTLATVTEGDVTTRYEYDVIGQIIARSGQGSTERFDYDANSRLVGASNAISQNTLSYDAVGNVLAVHQQYTLFDTQRDFLWRHSYDEIDNRIATRRPDGVETDWLISGSSYVHEMLLNKATLASFTRNDVYQEKSRTLMNSMQQRSEYDRAGRLQTQVLLEGNFHEKVRLKREYHYDKIGQLTGIADSTRGDALYRYDPLGRIVRSATPVFDETFSFDPASNITTAIATDKQTTTLPADVPAVVGNVLREYAGIHFEYDVQGNMVSKSSPGCRQAFTWNAFNQLVSVRTAKNGASDVVATYYYDAFGRRIGKQVAKGDDDPASVRVFYGWDGENLAFESIVGQESTKHYLYEYESFVPLAQYLSPASANAWTDTAADAVRDIAFFHCDHIGTPRELFDESQQKIWAGDYRFWGKQRNTNTSGVTYAPDYTHNNIRFQGQYYDSESGLHYNRYRYYDPDTGRYIRQDPIGLFGGINLYLYGPSSTMWIDPFGLAMWPSGQFNSWFNGQTADQIAQYMSSKSTRELIKKALRGSGGMHEWFPVSMAAKAKELGLNAETLKSWATPTVDVYFQNIKDKGNIIQGPHPSRNSSGCRASSVAHEQLMERLNTAKSPQNALDIIQAFARKHARNGGSQTGGFQVL
ncbi:type VI secretion system tip protein TssI/VgrG [Advenella incenata]